MNRRNILQGMLGGLGAWLLGKNAKAAPVETEIERDTPASVYLRVTEILGNGFHKGNVVVMSNTEPLLYAIPGTIEIHERHGSTIPGGTILLGHADMKTAGRYWAAYDVV